jgi:hypothetical protein
VQGDGEREPPYPLRHAAGVGAAALPGEMMARPDFVTDMAAIRDDLREAAHTGAAETERAPKRGELG